MEMCMQKMSFENPIFNETISTAFLSSMQPTYLMDH